MAKVHVPADQEDRPSMLCTLCRKHNELLKRMVWLTILCKLFQKDKLREHERSRCHMDAVKAEAMAVAGNALVVFVRAWKSKYHYSSRQFMVPSSACIALLRRKQLIIPSIDPCWSSQNL